jgi:hypothetical protein
MGSLGANLYKKLLFTHRKKTTVYRSGKIQVIEIQLISDYSKITIG